jgi:prepilin-type N-terminal cleavage/methylation domain-containing protein
MVLSGGKPFSNKSASPSGLKHKKGSSVYTISKRLNARKNLIAQNAESGFTLIELLITVVIIAILTAIAIPAYISVVSGAQDAAAKQTISSVIGAEDLYYSGSGTSRANVAAGVWAVSFDTAVASPNASDLATTGLITLDATKTRPGAGLRVNVNTVFVAQKSDNGTIWIASSDNRTPVVATSASQAATAVGAAIGAATTAASAAYTAATTAAND